MFKANEALLSKRGPTMQRIIRSGRQPVFTKEQLATAQRFFSTHPEDSEVLLFPDGLVMGDVENRRIITSRYLQVAHAQVHGWFPCVISRACVELWTWSEC